MELSKIDVIWPNALRWFLSQNLHSFTPWHLLQEPDEFEFAADAFKCEDKMGRRTFVFASRQDCDDFAGLEILDGKITDKVLCFHPVFGASSPDRTWDIVNAEFKDVFDFTAQQVIPDMKDWALTEDANDI